MISRVAVPWRIKFVLRPFLWIGENILPYAFMFVRVSDDVVVITRLPRKGDVIHAGEFCHADFVPTYDGCQIL